ncbi:hypothetical protein D3C85_1693000 [compost metagenome]
MDLRGWLFRLSLGLWMRICLVKCCKACYSPVFAIFVKRIALIVKRLSGKFGWRCSRLLMMRLEWLL